MRAFAFARRNAKELLRDPLTVSFGLGFPLVLLYLLSLLQRNIPVPMFEIHTLAPGVAAFGLTFIALFSALLLSKDRTHSLMMRLRASPMRPVDFIVGYILPLVPIAAAQTAVCLIAAIPLGLTLSVNALLCLLTLLPTALLYIAIGLICGALLNDKQVGGICGALLTNVCAWLSGIWFDTALLGSGFQRIARLLPFSNAVDAARAALSGNFSEILPSMLNVSAYAALLLILAVLLFTRKQRRGNL